MANKNLWLIGTNHFDLKGSQRLEGLLKHISPDIVALEFHKEREFLMEKKTSPEELKKELDDALRGSGFSLTPTQKKTMLEGITELNSVMGYELSVCKNYIHTNPKSRLEYIDIPILENGNGQQIIQEFKEGSIDMMRAVFSEAAQEPEIKERVLEILNIGKEAYLQVAMVGIEASYKNAEILEKTAQFFRNPETFELLKKQMPRNVSHMLEQIYNPRRDEIMANRINELYNGGSHKLAAVIGLMHIPGLNSRILELDPITMTLADYDSNSHQFD